MYAKPPPTLKAIRLVVICLAMGLISAAAAFAALQATGLLVPAAAPPAPIAPPGAPPVPPASQPDLMLFALAAVAVGVVLMLAIVPAQMLRQGARRFQQAPSEPQRDVVTLNTISSVTIMRCAMVEGVGLFGAVIFLLYGQWAVLLVPVLAALVIMAFYPTDAKAAAVRAKLERAGGELQAAGTHR
jgi:hypothetical protein